MLCGTTMGAFSIKPSEALLACVAPIRASARGLAGAAPAFMGAIVPITFSSPRSSAPKWRVTNRTANPDAFVTKVQSCTRPGTGYGFAPLLFDPRRRAIERFITFWAGNFDHGNIPVVNYEHSSGQGDGQLDVVGVVKPDLIDLETRKRVTGRKQASAVQRERLSDWALKVERCDSLTSAITAKKAERGARRDTPAQLKMPGSTKSNRIGQPNVSVVFRLSDAEHQPLAGVHRC